MSSPVRPTWQDPRVLTTLVLVFVAGAMAGAVSMRFGLHERIHQASGTLKDPNTAKAFLERCKKELHLTPQQSAEMATILDDYKIYYQSLQDQLEEVRATGKSRIMALLDDQQKARFEQLLRTEMQPQK
jgi:uncharacterized membrane-anchored protein YhcB (DUF1043 family)